MSVNTIINELNNLLASEFTVVQQYFIYARHLKHLGLLKLSEKFSSEIMEEMHHAELLADRILFLQGIPKYQVLNISDFPKDVLRLFKQVLVCEESTIDIYKNVISIADDKRDFGTSNMLQDILQEEEDHIKWLHKQISLIDMMGLSSYVGIYG